jgi:ribosomal RNA assembly protein
MEDKEFFKKNFLSRVSGSLVIKSKFSVIFPKYQEKNLAEKWFIIRRVLRFHHLETILNLKKGVIEISTTDKTIDPYSIISGRDFIKLISRGVPIHQAAKIFNVNVFCDIIKISNFTSNKKVFLNRRKKLIGHNGSTVKAIEMLTKSYILVQGNRVLEIAKI